MKYINLKNINPTIFRSVLTVCSLLGSIHSSIAQTQNTGASFLLSNQSARNSAMGGTEVSTAPYSNDFSNIAKLVFLEEESSGSLSYKKGLGQGQSQVSLSQIAIFKKLNERYLLASKFRYLSYGNTELIDNNQQFIGNFKPNEFAAELALSAKLGHGFSLSSAIKYIHSGILPVNTENSRSANAVAFDVNAFFSKETYFIDNPTVFSAGVMLTDIGTRLKYGNSSQPGLQLPSNLRLGLASSIATDDKSTINTALDLGKLLTPSQTTPANMPFDGPSVMGGIFKSFSDSPEGLKGELQEISVSIGAEYCYDNRFALRAGYHYENRKISDYSFMSLGAGFGYRSILVDLAYLHRDRSLNSMSGSFNISLAIKLGSKNNL